jgi:hypothetical protein
VGISPADSLVAGHRHADWRVPEDVNGEGEDKRSAKEHHRELEQGVSLASRVIASEKIKIFRWQIKINRLFVHEFQ